MDLVSSILIVFVSGLIVLLLTVFAKYYEKLREARDSYKEAKNTVKSLILGIKQRINEQDNKISSIKDEVAFFQARGDFLNREKKIDETKIEMLSAGVEAALTATNKFGTAVFSLKQDCEKIEKTQNEIQAQIIDLNMKQKSLEEIELSEKTKPQSEAAPSISFNLEKKEVKKGLDRLNPTEIHVLNLLSAKSMPAPEIGRTINKTREHTARLMKKLYEEGYIERDTNKMPYSYKINDNLRKFLEEIKGNVS